MFQGNTCITVIITIIQTMAIFIRPDQNPTTDYITVQFISFMYYNLVIKSDRTILINYYNGLSKFYQNHYPFLSISYCPAHLRPSSAICPLLNFQIIIHSPVNFTILRNIHQDLPSKRSLQPVYILDYFGLQLIRASQNGTRTTPQIQQQNLSGIQTFEHIQLPLSRTRQLGRKIAIAEQTPLNDLVTEDICRVMSLQGSKKSDIYEKMLGEETPVRMSNESNKSAQKEFNPFKSVIKFAPQPFNNRFSYEPKQDKPELNHICTCYQTCNTQYCPCYLTLEECQTDFCCLECIQYKKKHAVRSGLGPQQENKIFCTCKKTKCNKKYCTCFAAGIQCGLSCSCEDCLNCEQHVKIEVEPRCIVDEEIRQMQMPESMDFEPFSFRYSNNSSK